MARVTISIPDGLKDRLDAFADQNRLDRSQTVCRALEAFLGLAAPSPTPSDHGPLQAELAIPAHVAQVGVTSRNGKNRTLRVS